MAHVESEMFSEPPEPYFTMTADEFEQKMVKSASIETLMSGGSNVCHADVKKYTKSIHILLFIKIIGICHFTGSPSTLQGERRSSDGRLF